MLTRTGRKLAGIAAGAAIVGGSLMSAATPAQAYSPDPKPEYHTKKTYNCPGASGCQPGDVIDGTYFKKDPGGKAAKIGLWQSGKYIGKVEYHPYGEHLYVYDNARDNDAIYVNVLYFRDDGRPVHSGLIKGGSSMGDIHSDLDHPEGKNIYITVYDNRGSDGKGSNKIAEITARA